MKQSVQISVPETCKNG